MLDDNSSKEILTIGEKIKRLRVVAGLTQKELAQKIDLTAPTITKYEKGTLEPSIDTLNKIATLFNVNISIFVNDTEFKDSIKDIKNFAKVLINFDYRVYGFEYSSIFEHWIISPNGNRIILNNDDFNLLEKEISDFVDFKLNQIFNNQINLIGLDLYKSIFDSDRTEADKFKILTLLIKKKSEENK